MIDEKIAIENFDNSLARKYKNNPLPSAALSVLSGIPVVGMVIEGGQVILEHKIDQIYYDRLITMLDELNSSHQIIPDKLIDEEPFIHSVFLIYKSAINTFHREKIRYFARILRSSINKQELASDKFEEFIDILNGLSVRELRLLQLLHQFELKHPLEEGSDINELQIATQYWQDFTSQAHEQLDISEDMLPSMLVRLTRTGLYRIIIGSYLGYKGREGKTTALFKEFTEWIELENDVQEVKSQ